jgi:hypothetical protein
MGITLQPDPPLAVMVTGSDPDLDVGGVFDRRVFHDPVFDCGQIGANLGGDPPVGALVTLPDPVTA